MKEKAKAILAQAIKEGSTPHMLHGHVAFRPVPSMGLQMKLGELVGTHGGNSALREAFRELESAKATPDLYELVPNQYAACLTEGSRWFGWVFYKHPNGEWVSLRKMSPVEIAEMQACQRAENAFAEGVSS